MLSVIMLSVFMLSVIMLSVIMLSVIMLSVIMLSAIMLGIIMLTAIKQSDSMLNVVIHSVIRVSVGVPCKQPLANVVKLFFLSTVMVRKNKLECLSTNISFPANFFISGCSLSKWSNLECTSVLGSPYLKH